MNAPAIDTDNNNFTLGHNMAFLTSYCLHERGTAARRQLSIFNFQFLKVVI